MARLPLPLLAGFLLYSALQAGGVQRCLCCQALQDACCKPCAEAGVSSRCNSSSRVRLGSAGRCQHKHGGSGPLGSVCSTHRHELSLLDLLLLLKLQLGLEQDLQLQLLLLVGDLLLQVGGDALLQLRRHLCARGRRRQGQ